jgi:hypothetical protein
MSYSFQDLEESVEESVCLIFVCWGWRDRGNPRWMTSSARVLVFSRICSRCSRFCWALQEEICESFVNVGNELNEMKWEAHNSTCSKYKGRLHMWASGIHQQSRCFLCVLSSCEYVFCVCVCVSVWCCTLATRRTKHIDRRHYGVKITHQQGCVTHSLYP